MKKWNKMAALLLIGATSLTFTGCIDYDEPKGIESMRTAKAEFYSAQAALKNAEAKYKDAEAEIKLQELELKKLEVALAAAKNEAEIAQVSAKLENALLELKAAKEQKELAYQQAIAALNKGMWQISSGYRTELSDVLGKILTNRENYNSYAEQLMSNQKDLLSLATSVDSARLLAGFSQRINTSKERIAIYQNERNLLVSFKDESSQDRSAKMSDVYSQLSSSVADYNTNVVKYADVKKAYDDKDAEIDALVASQSADRSLWNKDASVTFEVPAAIQHDFLKMLSDYLATNPNDYLKSLWQSDAINSERVGYSTSFNEQYFCFSLKGTSYTGKLLSANYPIGTISPSKNPTVDLCNSISKVVKSGLSSSWLGAPVTAASLLDLTTEMGHAKTTSDNAKGLYDAAFATFDADKAAYIAARDAMQIVELESTSNLNTLKLGTSNYYNSVEDKIFEFDLSSQTDAEKQALVDVIKAYGPVREAFDGYVSMGNIVVGEKDYEKVDKTNVSTSLAMQIIGPSYWMTNKKASAYGKFAQLCRTLYGTQIGEVVLLPYDINEYYKSVKAGISVSQYPDGGLFYSYYDAYEDYQFLVEKKAWVDLESDVLAAMKPIEDAATAISEANLKNNAARRALSDELYDLGTKLNAITSISGTSIVSINVNSPDGILSVSNAATGTLGNSINRLIVYYNSLNSSVNVSYSLISSIENIDSLIETEKEILFGEEQNLKLFKSGAYTRPYDSDYLSVLLEQCNSNEKELKAKMEKLDKELELLQKERDNILAIINGTTTNE